jgi:hypothetical protein
LNDNEELRKKIIDSYDSQLKDIFTEDEILAILDALKPQTLATTNPGFWPTITTNANDIIHTYNNDMFKVHPEQDPLYALKPDYKGVTITSTANSATNTVMEQCEN